MICFFEFCIYRKIDIDIDVDVYVYACVYIYFINNS